MLNVIRGRPVSQTGRPLHLSGGFQCRMGNAGLLAGCGGYVWPGSACAFHKSINGRLDDFLLCRTRGTSAVSPVAKIFSAMSFELHHLLPPIWLVQTVISASHHGRKAVKIRSARNGTLLHGSIQSFPHMIETRARTVPIDGDGYSCSSRTSPIFLGIVGRASLRFHCICHVARH